MTQARQDNLDPIQVAEWLRQHPDFLLAHPDLALNLAMPRQTGSATSLASYQLDVLREKNRELNRRLHELFVTAQENERLAVRTQQLAMTLLRQRSAADCVRAVVASLGEDFAGDVVRVLLFARIEGLDDEPWLQVIARDSERLEPLRAFFQDSEPLCGRLQADKQRLLFAEAAEQVRSMALLAVPGMGAVAIGTHDGNRFYPGMGTLFLRLMGETLAAALARYSAP